MSKRDFFNKRKNVMYPSEADYLNYVPFVCFIPFYALPQPEIYKEGIMVENYEGEPQWEEFIPIYEPASGPTELAKTNLTINEMLNLYERDVTIIWQEDFDVPIILNWIDNYFLSVQDKVYQGNMAIIEYCRRLVKFRDEFFRKVFLRLYNKHGVIREMYDEDDSVQKKIDLANTFQSNSSLPTPLQKIEYAPIDLPPVKENDYHPQIKVPVDEKSSAKKRSLESASALNALRLLLSI